MPRNGGKPGEFHGSRRRAATRSVDSDDSLPAFPSFQLNDLALPSGRSRLFENAPVGCLYLDADNVVAGANRELAGMLKTAQERIVRADFSRFVASDSLHAFRWFRRRSRAAGSGAATELNLRNGAGTPFPARLQYLGIENGFDLLAVSDRSEVHEAWARLQGREQELRVARRQLERFGRREQDYLQIADVIMLGLNSAGEITLLNRRGCELLGCSGDEVRHRNWFELFLPRDERDQFREMFEQAVAENIALPEFVNNRVVTRQGRTRNIRWHSMTLRDAHGRVEGVLASGVDITDQLRTEQRLQRSQAALVNTRQKLDLYENMMVAVVESAADAVLTVSPGGLIQTVNRAAVRMFGHAEREMIGCHVSLLLPTPGPLGDGIERLVGQGREVTARRRDGESFPVHLSVGDIGEPASRVYTFVLRDLTREKQMQKKLQEQEALATVGRMAAVVAHEVRNPLAGISGVIQVFRARHEAGSQEHAVLGDVLSRIDGLVETIQDLLLYARPRALRPQPVRLSELLAQTARLVEEDPRFRAVEIAVEPSEVQLRLDSDYFREALLNLLINSAQAMNGAGEIHCAIAEAGGHVRVRIADNGPGIHPDIREKVFEAFFTTKARGTGLGLSFVKNVVERHGGDVSLHCPECGGTVITLILPAETRVADDR